MFKLSRTSASRRVPPGFWNPDAETIERIRAAYLRTLEAHTPETSPIWSHITQKQQDIHDALLRGGEQARSLLADPTATNLYYGTDNLAADILGGRNLTRGLDEDIRSQLAELAALVGAEPMPNPQGGLRYRSGSAPVVGIEQALASLDTVLPAPVDFPNPFRGEIISTESDRGFIGHRAIHAIYQAYRAWQCEPRGAARCLEIGAGTGRTAYYAMKFAIPAYTIVDLPMTAVGQACFLMATLGPGKVSLFGEGDHAAPGVVRLRPPHWLFATDEEFDVALNCDSLPEMSREYAARYIDFIQKRCRAFISINHEAGTFTVRDLWPGLMRFPHSLRPGYIEEFTPARR